MRLPAPALLFSALALNPVAGTADEMSDRLCPIFAEVSGATQGFIPEAVQAQVVMKVGSAYGYDPDALANVLDVADASTDAACPEERAAILAATGKESLYDVMR